MAGAQAAGPCLYPRLQKLPCGVQARNSSSDHGDRYVRRHAPEPQWVRPATACQGGRKAQQLRGRLRTRLTAASSGISAMGSVLVLNEAMLLTPPESDRQGRAPSLCEPKCLGQILTNRQLLSRLDDQRPWPGGQSTLTDLVRPVPRAGVSHTFVLAWTRPASAAPGAATLGMDESLEGGRGRSPAPACSVPSREFLASAVLAIGPECPREYGQRAVAGGLRMAHFERCERRVIVPIALLSPRGHR